MQEIHSGSCGHHAQPRYLVAKAFRQGFFWLTAKAEAERLVKRCKGCQFYAKQKHLPAKELKTIPITWPFTVWGLDMVGPFKTARGGLTHLLVAVDKYTKWVEARPIKKLDGPTAVTPRRFPLVENCCSFFFFRIGMSSCIILHVNLNKCFNCIKSFA